MTLLGHSLGDMTLFGHEYSSHFFLKTHFPLISNTQVFLSLSLSLSLSFSEVFLINSINHIQLNSRTINPLDHHHLH